MDVVNFFDGFEKVLILIGSAVMPFVSIVFDITRFLFFFIDTLIYSVFIPPMYEFCKYLAGFEFIASETKVLNIVARSIYSLLSVAMLFKLAFSLLTLLADPDKIEDKEKGAARLFTNALVVLVLIIVIPMVFSAAAHLQDRMLGIQRSDDGKIIDINTGIIDKVFISNNPEFCAEDGTCPSVGVFLSKAVLGMFLRPTPDTNALEDPSNVPINTYKSVFDDGGDTFNMFPLLGYLNDKTNRTDLTVYGDISGGQVGDAYTFSYITLISTAVGLYLLWTFISLAIDIATRAIKLFALKLISPIAIISYLDTSSQTKGVFKKWTDEVIKTYLSLFIRLATLSIFAIVLKSIDWAHMNFFIKIFFFLGLLTFLKTAPKMFENIFGFTGKTKEEGFGASMLRGALGAGAAGTAGAIAGGISSKKQGLGFGVGALHGGWAGASGGWKGASSGKAGDFGKALFGGPSAAGKALGYKGGMDLIKDKINYNAKKNAADASYITYKNAYDTGQDNAAADVIMGDLKRKGIGHFNQNDFGMIRKYTKKTAGVNALFGNSTKGKEAASAVNGLNKAKLAKNVYERQVETMDAIVKRKGNQATQQEIDELQGLIDMRGKINKDVSDAETEYNRIFKDNPDYLKEQKLIEQFTFAESQYASNPTKKLGDADLGTINQTTGEGADWTNSTFHP